MTDTQNLPWVVVEPASADVAIVNNLPAPVVSAQYRARIADILALPSDLLKGKKVHVQVNLSIMTTIESSDDE